jgi:hypothetical protein
MIFFVAPSSHSRIAALSCDSGILYFRLSGCPRMILSEMGRPERDDGSGKHPPDEVGLGEAADLDAGTGVFAAQVAFSRRELLGG